MKLHRPSTRQRRGASAVEFALILPLLTMFVFGSIEMGRAVMVQHVLEEAARAGARVAATDNGNRADTLAMVDTAMERANMDGYTVNLDPFDPADSDGDPVSVEVSIPYNQVSWMNWTRFMDGKTLSGLCVMPTEEDIIGKKKGKDKSKESKKAKKAKKAAKAKLKKAKTPKGKTPKKKNIKTKSASIAS